MERLITAIEKMNRGVGCTVPYILVVMVLIGSYEVFVRYFFNRPTVWAWETNGLLNLTVVAMAGGYCLLEKAHVRVDIFYNRVSDRSKVVLDLVTFPLVFIFLGVMLYYGVPRVLHSIAIQETSTTVFRPPIYPFKIIMIIGVVLIFLQALANFLRDLMFFVRRKEIK